MKLFLIDGHALIFKMYYAFLGRPMINSKGEDTSILFGFTKYLLELLEREHPSHVAVSFDPPGGTFRNRLYPEYKANRGETPQLVIDALEPLTELLRGLGIPVLTIPDFEADDVIGTMAKRFGHEGMEVYMVTPDKDYGQLVEEGIFQYRPGKSGENEVLGPREICEKWKIGRPEQVIDILALCGDSSDNVPGVDGVGPVGAAKLLGKYGSVEEIYAHLGELTPRQQEQFEAARGHIDLSKRLVTIKTDVPLTLTAQQMAFDGRFSAELPGLFERYEFLSLRRFLSRLGSVSEQEAPAPEARQLGTLSPVRPAELAAAARKEGRVGLWLSEDCLTLSTSLFVCSCAPAELKDLLEDGSVRKAGFELKNLLHALSEQGIGLEGPLQDAALMHYLLDPERSHRYETLCATLLGVQLEAEAQEPQQTSLFDAPKTDDAAAEDRSAWAAALLPLCDELARRLDENGLVPLYDEIEEPLIRVLFRMEEAGVKIDLASLSDFADSLRAQMLAREEEVRSLAGDPALNVSSPKQVGEVIFEKLRLDPRARKPAKGNWPTDEETLQALADRSPIIDAILDYRGLRKLLSTYIEPFAGYVSPRDGRVHTTFNQALTATGRLSSSNPNLQNIPVRTEQGQQIRRAFVAGSPDAVMMSADYSQIELRIMAHLSGDGHLTEAFRRGEDVHAATAAKIFGIPVSEVTADQRRIAKTANFGIMYGISSFGLSQRLRLPRGEAKKIIDDYFASFPAIRSFIDDTLARARECGYVQTLFGRRRYVPGLEAHNANLRALAERNAVNAPIQGSSADIIKIAMIRVDERLRAAGLRARMVLQIHDELLLEVPKDEVNAVREIVVHEMENVVSLSVPLTVDCHVAQNWLEAH
ncbi:MAG: DNA polymerase I [Bacteroidales bacterium]|nr:DNA polymerase I [Bacteroidales bacterium]